MARLAMSSRVCVIAVLMTASTPAEARELDDGQLDAAIVRVKAGSFEERVLAAKLLLTAGSDSREAADALIKALTTNRQLDLYLAAKVAFPPVPVPDTDTSSLARALQDDDRFVRCAAAYSLARLGREAESAIPALAKALTDSDKHPRNFAAVALGMMGPAAREAVPELIEALEDRGTDSMTFQYVCASAALALGSIGPDARAAENVLVRMLEDRIGLDHPRHVSNCPEVRAAAAYALGRIGSDTPEAIASLRAALSDGDPLARYHAVVALAAVDGSTETRALLNGMLGDPDDDVCLAAQKSLAGSTDIRAPGLDVLAERLTESRNGNADFAASLLRFAAAARPALRDSIALALGYLSADNVLTVANLREPAGTSEDDQTRRHAIRALGKLNRDVVPVLLTVMKQSR